MNKEHHSFISRKPKVNSFPQMSAHAISFHLYIFFSYSFIWSQRLTSRGGTGTEESTSLPNNSVQKGPAAFVRVCAHKGRHRIRRPDMAKDTHVSISQVFWISWFKLFFACNLFFQSMSTRRDFQRLLKTESLSRSWCLAVNCMCLLRNIFCCPYLRIKKKKKNWLLLPLTWFIYFSTNQFWFRFMNVRNIKSYSLHVIY